MMEGRDEHLPPVLVHDADPVEQVLLEPRGDRSLAPRGGGACERVHEIGERGGAEKPSRGSPEEVAASARQERAGEAEPKRPWTDCSVSPCQVCGPAAKKSVSFGPD